MIINNDIKHQILKYYSYVLLSLLIIDKFLNIFSLSDFILLISYCYSYLFKYIFSLFYFVILLNSP